MPDSDRTPENDVDDAPMSPADMLALSAAQQQKVADFVATPTIVIVLAWGVAWFVGFLMLWGASPDSPIAVPRLLAGIVFTGLMIAGVLTSVIAGVRTGAGIRGRQQFQGTLYGCSWAVGCAAVPVLGGALSRAGMSGEVAALFYPAAYCIVVGLLYLVGAALWNDRAMIVIGAWIVLVGVAAPYVGAPTSYLVMALAGGGAFIVYGAVLVAARVRRSAQHRTVARS